MTDTNQMTQNLTQICVIFDEFYPYCATFADNFTLLDLMKLLSFKIILFYSYIRYTDNDRYVAQTVKRI
jgi:hypothetical protein